MHRKRIICIAICLLSCLCNFAQTSQICLTVDESKLLDQINAYRKTKKLNPIPYSEKLTAVAQTHAKDLEVNYTFDPKNECNPHSWSDKGNWTSCCYTNDHKEAECMWNKPMEISGYSSSGYEIAFYHSDRATANDALAGWKLSKSHNELLINQGIWQKINWKAIGIGIYGKYATVWFGEIEDNAPKIICSD